MLFGPGNIQEQMSAGYDSFTLNDANDKIGWRFTVPTTGTITDIGFYHLSTTGSPPDYRVSLQTCADNGTAERVPTGSAYGGAVATDWTPGTLGWRWITLSTPASATVGDICAAVVEASGTAPTGSNYIRLANQDIGEGYTLSDTGGLEGLPYASGGTWFDEFRPRRGNIAVRYDDGTVYGMYADPTDNYAGYNSASTPDEVGALFTVPFSCTLSSVHFPFTTTLRDGALRLYDADDNVLSTKTIVYADEQMVRQENLPLPPVILSANTNYRITFARSDSSPDHNFTYIQFFDEADRYVVENGANFSFTSRTDSGSWTDDNTRVPWLALVLSDISGLVAEPAKVAGNVTATYNGNAITSYLSTASLRATLNAVDNTNFASTATEYITGLTTWKFPIGGHWDITLNTIFAPDLVASPDTLRTFAITLDSVTYTWTANAFISDFVIESAPKDAIKWTGIINCSGAPTVS